MARRRHARRRDPKIAEQERVEDAVRRVEECGELADSYANFLLGVIEELRIRHEDAAAEDAAAEEEAAEEEAAEEEGNS